MMAFLAKAAAMVVGSAIGSMFGRKKPREQTNPLAAIRQVTRDDAKIEAERERDLARRRGAGSDRIVTGGNSVPAGGLGRLIVGS
jgi:hypothetical protein